MKKTNSILFSLFISLSITIGLLSTLSTASAGSQSIKKSDKFSNHSLSATTPLTANEPFELLGQLGGLINHVEVSGTYAYVNIDRRLVVLDVSNPKSILLVDDTNLLSADSTDIDIYNHHLFITTSDGFYAFTLSDPRSPQLLGSYLVDGYKRKSEFRGNYAYSVADDYLSIFDISDPTSLKRQTFRKIGSGYFEDSSPKLTIAGNTLYNMYCWSHVDAAAGKAVIPEEENGAGYCAIDVYSLADPVNTVQIGTVGVSYPFDYDHRFILANGNQLFSSDSSLGIFDVSEPANAVQKSLVDVGTQGFTSSPGVTFMVKQNQYLYLAGEQYVDETKSQLNAWFQVVDITNPTSPTVHSAIAMPHSIRDMAIVGNYVYATDGSLQILDVSNPAAPTTIGRYSVYGEAIADSRFMIATNDHIYLAGKKLLTIDTSTPTNIAVASVYTTIGNATSLAISDTRAYLHLVNQAGDKWLRILDTSQPTITTQLGYLLPSAANDSKVVGDLLYTVNAQGFTIIDVSQPLTPTLLDTIHTAHPATALEIIGSYAYVILEDGYVVTIDLTQRQIVASQQFNAVDIRHEDNKLIVKNTIGAFNGYTKVQVLQVDNPLQPVEVTNYCIAAPGAWAASSGFLFIVNGNELEAFNLNDLSQQLPYASLSGRFSQVAAHNNQLLLTENGRLQMFRWIPPITPTISPKTLSLFINNPILMVNLPTSVQATINPPPSYPFTFTWQMDDLPIRTIIVEGAAELCERFVHTTSEPISWQSVGLKNITVTVENNVGVVSTTKSIFIDSYLPITIGQEISATLTDCDRVSGRHLQNCQFDTLLEIPAATVSETTQIQYTRNYTLPHPFDNTILNESGEAWIVPIALIPTTDPHAATPFELEAIRNQQKLDELLFTNPFTITRAVCIFSQNYGGDYYADKFHLRRWDGKKWVREATDFHTKNDGGCGYTFDVAIKRTGEYAFFDELRHTTDWSYLPLITRN